MANIGMMEGAYFVGRVELLNWLNDLLKLDYTKVEQTCSGMTHSTCKKMFLRFPTAAAHCQIFDAIYPGAVTVNFVKSFCTTNPPSVFTLASLISFTSSACRPSSFAEG